VNRPRWRPAYVGIGSNMADPVSQVGRAIEALGRIADTRLVASSGLYRSAPLDGSVQPDYVNAVAALLTRLPSAGLLAALQAIETAAGRDRSAGRWGPRTLDLDLLAVAAETIDTDALVLPHPGVAARNFVLLPWCEIAPLYRVPALGTVVELAGRLPDGPRIERLA